MLRRAGEILTFGRLLTIYIRKERDKMSEIIQ